METLSNASTSLCASCARKVARYTCPRCHSRTCSLECYRVHANGTCRAGFVADAFSDALQGETMDEKERIEMSRMLLRHLGVSPRDASSCSSEEDEEEEGLECDRRSDAEASSASRVDDDDEVLRRMVSQVVLEPWKPWWWTEDAFQMRLSKDGTSLVMEWIGTNAKQVTTKSIDDGWNDSTGSHGRIPRPPSNPLPSLRSLLPRSTVSCPDVIRWHVADATFGYCAAMRVYNGEWESDAIGAMHVAVQCSSVWEATLQKDRNVSLLPKDDKELVSACSSRCASCIARGAAPTLLLDVERIWRCGRAALLLAMRDAARLCASGKQKHCAKKMLFFCAWANEEEGVVFERMADSLKRLANDLSDTLQGHLLANIKDSVDTCP